MRAGDGYALDLATPVRHVATELGRVAPATLPFGELVVSYRLSNPGDLSRIMRHEGAKNNDEAVAWLIRRAVQALGVQVETASDGGLRLAKPFDELRYERKKIVRLVDEDANDERRALRAVYADLREDRVFYVQVGAKERRYTLHPLARAIPQMPEEEFLKVAADIKAHGVKVPIVIYDKQVLDGRHRVAVASALKMPVRVEEFKGTEEQARDHVISLNLQRRHLEMSQRVLIVRELYLPQAKAEAEKHAGGRPPKGDEKPGAEMRQVSRGPKAAQIAAQRSNGLANARAIETMAPVDNAPKTKERIRSGEIKTVSAARREALKETGEAGNKVPKFHSNSAYRALGRALRHVREACDSLENGERGDATVEQVHSRVKEIREQLDRVERLTNS